MGLRNLEVLLVDYRGIPVDFKSDDLPKILSRINELLETDYAIRDLTGTDIRARPSTIYKDPVE